MSTLHCFKSGFEFQLPFFKTKLSSQHPIFYEPLNKLQGYYSLLLKNALQPEEEILLYLSLLDKTNLISWSCAAKPARPTIFNSISNLISLLSIIHTYPYKAELLPHFHISQDTHTLTSIPAWIDSCLKLLAQSKAERIAEGKKKVFIKEIDLHSGDKKITARRLASWAASACEFPANISAYWKDLIVKLYTTAASDLLTIRLVDVEELRDHLENYLEQDQTGYIIELSACANNWLTQSDTIYGTEFNVSREVAKETKALSFAIVESEGTKPVRESFDSPQEYNKAYAAWMVSCMRKGKGM